MAELKYPQLLNNEVAFPASIMFTFFNRRSTRDSGLTDTIMLYMPEEFGQPSTLSWDTFSATEAMLSVAGDVGGVLAGGAKSFGKFVSGGKGAGLGRRLTGGLISGATSALTTAAGVMRQYATAGSPLNNLGGAITGAIPNPYMTQIFRGVNFRNFTYTFRLVPFHPDDCTTIKTIVNTFRKWSLPTGPEGAGSPFLNYPGECEIEYRWAGGVNPWIHKFKRSVITSLDVNYTGAGMWSMMRNGFPAETVLKITLSEIALVIRNDVEDDY